MSDEIEAFEQLVLKSYYDYVCKAFENEELVIGEWPEMARKRGIVLRWSQKEVSIVDNGIKVRTFRCPYGE